MELSRRRFIKGVLTGGAVTTAFGFDVTPALAQARELKISRTTETHSICPYCAVACGVIIHTLGDKAGNVKPTVIHVEGVAVDAVDEGGVDGGEASLVEDQAGFGPTAKLDEVGGGFDRWHAQ